MRFEEKGVNGQPTLVVSRRNLLALLAKLDGYPENSRCAIQHPGGGIILKAEEDEVHYAKRPAGQMIADTEDRIPKPSSGTAWA